MRQPYQHTSVVDRSTTTRAFNLRDDYTQARLSAIPKRALQVAMQHVKTEWAQCDFPDDDNGSTCPYKPISGDPKPQIYIAIQAGKIVGWACRIEFTHGVSVRVAYHNTRTESTTQDHMSSHLITCVSMCGTTRTVKWFNNRWQNVDY